MTEDLRPDGSDGTQKSPEPKDRPDDESVLSLYARFLEPLAGRGGRELQERERKDFLQSLSRSTRAHQVAKEYAARLHRPEAVVLLLDLEYAHRITRLAQRLEAPLDSLHDTVSRARAIFRGTLEGTRFEKGVAVPPPWSENDKALAAAALGQVDGLRAALARGPIERQGAGVTAPPGAGRAPGAGQAQDAPREETAGCYVLVRCWLGFTDLFPVHEFDDIPDEDLLHTLVERFRREAGNVGTWGVHHGSELYQLGVSLRWVARVLGTGFEEKWQTNPAPTQSFCICTVPTLERAQHIVETLRIRHGTLPVRPRFRIAIGSQLTLPQRGALDLEVEDLLSGHADPIIIAFASDARRIQGALDSAAQRADSERVVGRDDVPNADAVPREAGHEPEVATPAQGIFAREGIGWRLGFGGVTRSFPDREGFERIRILLEHPDKEVSAVALLGRAPTCEPEPVQDRRTRKEVAARMAELRRAIDSDGDPSEVAAAREELEALEAQVAAATGLRGKPRHLSADGKRAANASGKSMNDAIALIESAGMKDLAAHLRESIVGISSSNPMYRSSRAVQWDLLGK